MRNLLNGHGLLELAFDFHSSMEFLHIGQLSVAIFTNPSASSAEEAFGVPNTVGSME